MLPVKRWRGCIPLRELLLVGWVVGSLVGVFRWCLKETDTKHFKACSKQRAPAIKRCYHLKVASCNKNWRLWYFVVCFQRGVSETIRYLACRGTFQECTSKSAFSLLGVCQPTNAVVAVFVSKSTMWKFTKQSSKVESWSWVWSFTPLFPHHLTHRIPVSHVESKTWQVFVSWQNGPSPTSKDGFSAPSPRIAPRCCLPVKGPSQRMSVNASRIIKKNVRWNCAA